MVSPKWLYKTHTPCIHRHTGLIMASLNVLIKLVPSSPFPLFLHWRSPLLPFCLLFLFPFSSISWAMLAVSISFYNLHFIGCHVFDIRSGHIHFQGHYFWYFLPSVCSIFLVTFFALVIFCFQFFPCYYFAAATPWISGLTRKSNSLSSLSYYRRVRLLSPEPRLLRSDDAMATRTSNKQ